MQTHSISYSITSHCYMNLINYAKTNSNNEVCGILLCSAESQTISKFQPIANNDANPEVAFNFDPNDWVKQYYRYTSLGYTIVGFFHSHPNEEAVPSVSDIMELSYTNMLYIIISLKQKNSPQLRCYHVTSDNKLENYKLMLT